MKTVVGDPSLQRPGETGQSRRKDFISEYKCILSPLQPLPSTLPRTWHLSVERTRDLPKGMWLRRVRLDLFPSIFCKILQPRKA